MDSIKRNRIKCAFFEIVPAMAISSALSFALFYAVDVDFIQFLGIAFSVLFFFLIKFCVCKSSINFTVLSSVLGTFLGVFLFRKYEEGFRISFDATDFWYISLIFVLVAIFVIAFIVELYRKNISLKNAENYFSERKYDLSRIKRMLWRHDIIGIDATWGDGKTFLLNLLEKELQNKCFFVRVGVLSVTIDSVESFILNEINHLLENAHILSSASSKIRKLLAQPILYGAGDMLFSSDSYTELFKQLKKDVRKLKKIVVITFEDIDRIEDKEVIYKIFSIAEMLAGKGIKIVYQYDEKQLLSVLEEDKLYLEKYIPHATALTQIPFDKIVSIFIEKKNYANVEKKDFYFLTRSAYIPDVISRIIKLGNYQNLVIPRFSIRKMKLFLDEVNEYVVHDFNNLKNTRQSVISFFYIKHFCYELYEKLALQKNFLEVELFVYRDKFYSLNKLLKVAKIKWDEVWEKENNKTALIMLILLGYNFTEMIEPFINTARTRKKSKSVYAKVYEYLKEREENEKVDRMINHLFAEGKSEYTDYENVVREMEKKVLHVPDERQKAEYVALSKDMYENQLDRDNKTIFKIGIQSMVDLFRAFDIYEGNPEEWIKLLKFYFDKICSKEITLDLIEVLVCCRLTSRKVYRFILETFNQMKVVGNLNKIEVYQKFLDKYISAFSSLGYVDTREANWIDAAGLQEISVIKENVFAPLKKKLFVMQNETQNAEMKEEINAMIAFLDKNDEIISCKNPASNVIAKKEKDRSPFDVVGNYVDAVEKENLSNEEIKIKLNEDYKNEKLRPYEFNELWKHFTKEKGD